MRTCGKAIQRVRRGPRRSQAAMWPARRFTRPGGGSVGFPQGCDRFGSTTGPPPSSASFLSGPPQPSPCPGGAGVAGVDGVAGLTVSPESKGVPGLPTPGPIPEGVPPGRGVGTAEAFAERGEGDPGSPGVGREVGGCGLSPVAEGGLVLGAGWVDAQMDGRLRFRT